uniref:NIPSNAP family protein n=1 Tax=Roseihalotalea indica TaxID=2867963 RepID=A0AA49GMC5_9BACT|nr:NIPSNAP family protein [Tunicatimonas sp. TK19036]
MNVKPNNLRILSFLLCFVCSVSLSYGQKDSKYFYQLKVYHLGSDEQQQQVDQYLEEAYVPAMHRAGIEHVGVFHTIEDESPKTYVFVPYASLSKVTEIEQALEKDKKYQKAGSDYINAAHDAAPYDRIENILLRAFPGMPSPAVPDLDAPKSERFYELRSYEGPTEKLYTNKVKMFNDGDEVGIFDRLDFNAVFYAEVLFGSSMPNLMYMTTFENREERDERWEAFNNDPAWVKLKAMDEYKNNVSKADLIFLRPAEYSDY